MRVINIYYQELAVVEVLNILVHGKPLMK